MAPYPTEQLNAPLNCSQRNLPRSNLNHQLSRKALIHSLPGRQHAMTAFLTGKVLENSPHLPQHRQNLLHPKPSHAPLTLTTPHTNARSPYTTDADTTVSDLKTVFTESMAAQSKMLQQFMANSQQQQQQLMQAHQSQQASTNQILHHISSLMSTMVSGGASIPPSGAPPPPIPSTVNVKSPNATTAQDSLKTPPSHKSPNKRTAPTASEPTRRRDLSSSHDSDTTMSNTENPSTIDTNAAAPVLDPDSMRLH
jgi:type II secretory pathway pseudopilin PulG